MADRVGRCVNIGNCSLADKRQPIIVQPGTDFICPECGKGLITALGASGSSGGTQRNLLMVGGSVLALAIVGGALLGLKSCSRTPGSITVALPAIVSSGGTEPMLRIGGSNTIGDKLAPALAAAWLKTLGCTSTTTTVPAKDESVISCEADGKTLSVSISAKGTETGFSGLASGAFDIAMASDRIDPAQAASLAALGDMTAPASEHVIAFDGVAIVVNPGNPVRKLSLDQAAGLFSGVIGDWAQVGGTPGHVQVYARDEKSGTWKFFKRSILDSHGATLANDAKRFESGTDLGSAVLSDPGGIGFVGFNSIASARPVALAAAGAQSLVPNRFSIATEDYALSRQLYLYTAAAPKRPNVLRFLAFVASPAGQAVVEATGFVPRTVKQETMGAQDGAPARYTQLTNGALRLTSTFRFDSGKSSFNTRSLSEPELVEQFLTDNHIAPDKLMLFGFADSRGGEALNLRLSQDRANYVREALATRGLTPGIVEGFGTALPVADNVTTVGQQKNRRVEVWIKR
ncbi:phosphate ABC transporter substrate-binding/OmpA family protein [Sphingomonas sp. MMS24-J13]|uniref:phosphate ABC transporter substrate-binding/OmpA family protein n=1 Tax=Sphingomonas sp. MMS24-J13 TaxID=3238686 RepID=UPI00384E5842